MRGTWVAGPSLPRAPRLVEGASCAERRREHDHRPGRHGEHRAHGLDQFVGNTRSLVEDQQLHAGVATDRSFLARQGHDARPVAEPKLQCALLLDRKGPLKCGHDGSHLCSQLSRLTLRGTDEKCERACVIEGGVAGAHCGHRALARLTRAVEQDPVRGRAKERLLPGVVGDACAHGDLGGVGGGQEVGDERAHGLSVKRGDKIVTAQPIR